MHEVSENYVYNAQKSPQSPLEEFITLPKPLVDWRGAKTPPQTHLSLLNAFVVSLHRLWRLKSNVPLPKQFSGGSAPERIGTKFLLRFTVAFCTLYSLSP